MKNVYDIRLEKGLEFILNKSSKEHIKSDLRVAVVLYFYYLDTLDNYYQYIDAIPDMLDIIIISPLELVIDRIKKHYSYDKKNICYIIKPNRGRDISGLLVAIKDRIYEYDYMCFVHDKKEHSSEMKRDTELWIDNIWGNLLGSEAIIEQIIALFEKQPTLGVLTPPDPIGEHFCSWYGYGWHGSYEATKSLAERLKLNCDISRDRPPIALGTALWFRNIAMKKLFQYDWTYEMFDDSELENTSYISFGVERIFPYVAQDAGFNTGEVLSVDYAAKQNLILKDMMTRIFSVAQIYFPFPTVEYAEKLNTNIEKLVEYAGVKKSVALYGAGDAGRFCLSILRKNGINPTKFIVTTKLEIDKIDDIPVRCIEDVILDNEGVIISVLNQEIQKEIVEELINRGYNDYFIFWE